MAMFFIVSVIILAVVLHLSEEKKRLCVVSAAAVFLIQCIAATVAFSSYSNVLFPIFIFVTLADVFVFLPLVVYSRKKLSAFLSDNKKWITGLSFGMAAVLTFEAFVCNFGAFRLTSPSSYDGIKLLQKDMITDENKTDSDVMTVNSNEERSFEFDNINAEIGTIYMDLEVTGAPTQNVGISYTDETTSEFRSNAALNYISGDESSKYITCSFFGKVGNLKFHIKASEGSTVKVNDILLNSGIPFHFSLIRFTFILAAVWFLITMLFCPAMKKECGKSKTFIFGAAGITVVFVLIGVGLFLIRGWDNLYKLIDDPDVNQMNQEIVDSFEAHQVSMLEEPSDVMLNIENPYDLSQRSEAGANYPWDHLFYEGKYYSYYGIGTVLTLFLPYHLITGDYFSSIWATCIYSLMGIIFLSLSYFVFVRKLFPKTPNVLALAGQVIVLASSFVWYCITIGNFYELAQVSGFAFLAAGTYFLLCSGVIGNHKISKVNIAIATTLLSISVLCRAVMALYCMVSLIFIFAGVKKIINSSETKTLKANRKTVMKFLLAAMLPFVLIGSVQMVYNYLRFGSVLNFGIQYTLTIYDYQHIQFQFPLILIAIYNYLFTVPKVSTVFPFVTSNYDSLSVNGYYFLAGFSSAGLIFRAFPVLGYVFGRRAYKSAGTGRKTGAAIILTGCVIVPIIQMIMIWEYGYTPRYAVDFAWQILFGAFAILFTLYANKETREVRRILEVIFVISAIVSVVINMALTYEFVLTLDDRIPDEIRCDILSYGRLFEFWNIM